MQTEIKVCIHVRKVGTLTCKMQSVSLDYHKPSINGEHSKRTESRKPPVFSAPSPLVPCVHGGHESCLFLHWRIWWIQR